MGSPRASRSYFVTGSPMLETMLAKIILMALTLGAFALPADGQPVASHETVVAVGKSDEPTKVEETMAMVGEASKAPPIMLDETSMAPTMFDEARMRPAKLPARPMFPNRKMHVLCGGRLGLDCPPGTKCTFICRECHGTLHDGNSLFCGVV
ncbi:hypothetical protein XA68_14089 [Ophiocordyceps unilateralis]|uniref:Uncharacterized protein n=1 Tax=Ophiocordyceps unilateralis TaxID=268505 RepID=A0A2A9PBG2_OPHUN|nr:hypothetical protein XA68_14089 [Ophiocordyceps unilateralis]